MPAASIAIVPHGPRADTVVRASPDDRCARRDRKRARPSAATPAPEVLHAV